MHKYNSQKLNGTGKVNIPATCGTAERSASLSWTSLSEKTYWYHYRFASRSQSDETKPSQSKKSETKPEMKTTTKNEVIITVTKPKSWLITNEIDAGITSALKVD